MDHEIDDSHLGTKYVENRDDAAGWQSLGERIPMEEEDQASPQLPPARSGAYQNCQQPEPNHQQQQHVEASRAWGGHQAPATRPASSAFSSRPPFPPTRSSTTAHMNASIYHRATGPLPPPPPASYPVLYPYPSHVHTQRLPSQHAPYIRTARGLTEPAGERRWNPILGGYVRAAHAEADMAEEIRERDVANFEKGMARVMVREGEYDPVFWRHRLSKEEARYVPPRRGQQVVHPVSGPTLGVSLRLDGEGGGEGGGEGRWPGFRATRLMNDKWHRDDHVRKLFDPNDPLGRSVHGDTFRPCPNRQVDHRPTSLPPSTTTLRGDHVGFLLRDEPSPLIPQTETLPRRGKAGVAFHNTLRSPTDVCVGNLINAEKARRLPVPNLFPVQNPKSRYGLFMKSGEEVRAALHAHAALDPPSFYTTYTPAPGNPVLAPRPDAHAHPYRRPQYLDVRQELQAHLAGLQHASPSSVPPSPVASPVPSTPSSSASGHCLRPIDRTLPSPPPPPPLTTPPRAPSSRPSSSPSSFHPSPCGDRAMDDMWQAEAFLSGGRGEGGREGGMGDTLGGSVAASVGSGMQGGRG
ncbi:hypothetical protein NSK_005358 [Nannochloropsis salina CCMP1776]|uniref:Uncharacterized protein n=1 Tax=Nannochloropsis salina CCMP1776 TaxID=1027361 RepID=A0A4D9CXU7_9STRA|nr:hypothetical protein NSK_005358 [Nannochloropsis salina CCMP1776]|eukprot:TFJ83294.1 hypothetical protein NSK_005358 [Nannochloropsis salina CCMP1776]